MASQTTIWWLLLLLATFTAVSVQQGPAEMERLLPPIPLGILPHFPGQSPTSTPTDLECLSTLFNVPGCVGAIFNSIFTGQFDNISYDCCKAYSAMPMSADCAKMFDIYPSFPPLLKEYCASIAAPPEA